MPSIGNHPEPGRRGLLKRTAAGIAGLFGLTLVAKPAEAASPSPPGPVDSPAAAPLAATTMTLYSPYLINRTFRQTSVEGGSSAEQTTLFSELYDQPAGGTMVGELRSIGFTMPSPFEPTPYTADSVQFQVFTLAGGVIYGIGAIIFNGGWFAVVGGTGQYLGVQGRYRATQSLAELGGDQTATFEFDLLFFKQLFVAAAEKIMAKAFLKLDGVPGESLDAAHVGEIEVASVSWEDVRKGAGPGSTGMVKGTLTVGDLRFTVVGSKAGPRLMSRCAQGIRSPNAVLAIHDTGPAAPPEPFVTVILTDALITSYVQSSSADFPTEQFSLNFTKIEFEYRKSGVSVKGSWNRKTGT